MVNLKKTLRLFVGARNSRIGKTCFCPLIILLYTIMICGVLSGCSLDKKATGIETAVSSGEERNAISDATSEGIESDSGEDMAIMQTGTYSGEDIISESGSVTLETPDSGEGDASNQSGENNTEVSTQADPLLEDLKNRTDQTLSSVEEINRMISTMQQDMSDLKETVDRQSHTMSVLNAFCILQAILILIVTGNTISIIVMNRNHSDAIDDVDSKLSELKDVQEAQDKALDEHFQGTMKNYYDDLIRQMEDGIRSVEDLVSRVQETKPDLPTKVYFKVSGAGTVAGQPINLEKNPSTSAPFYGTAINGSQYELYPNGNADGTIGVYTLYTTTMKNCFDIYPNEKPGGKDRFSISRCNPAMIQWKSGNQYTLSSRGRLEVL